MRATTYRRTFYACVCAVCAALALLAFLPAAKADTEGALRVKLTRLGTPSKITLRADCDYTLAEDPSIRIPAGAELTVSAAAGQLSLTSDGAALTFGTTARLLRDGSGHRGVTFISPALSNRFCGDLAFSASDDVITAVLRINVEDYLYGVVGYELAPSSAPEALKAQAIVARSYALRQKSARGGGVYDLSDSGDALSFRGYNAADEYAASIRAVDDTCGQVLCYGDELAACYFCDSNGGQTESSANALGVPLAYTQVMDDPYDLDSAGVKKSVALRKDGTGLPGLLEGALIDSAAEALKQQGFSADLTGVSVAAIGAVVPEAPRFAEPSRLYSALAMAVSFSGQTAQGEAITAPVTVHIPTYGGIEDWCDLGINDEDNETVWVSQTDRAFEITFRRHGLGVGMSQRGAQAMAKKGLSCEIILEYYYPGTDIRVLDLADDSAARSAKPEAAAPIATARLSQKSLLFESADGASEALTTLPAGATVTVYGVQGEWAAIGSGDLYGFVRAEGLASFALSGAAAAQALDETFAPVGAGPVDLLQLPVVTALPLATLENGQYVQILAYNSAWCYVRTEEGLTGYVNQSSLSAVQQTAAAGEDAIDGGPVTVLKHKPARYVGADSLPLYESYSTESEVLATLQRGEKVLLGAYNAKWACVRVKGVTGFVAIDALTDALPAQTPIEGGAVIKVKGTRYVTVVTAGAALYATWSDAGAPLATLNEGDRVQLGAYNGQWACVRLDGLTGFMRIETLELEG